MFFYYSLSSMSTAQQIASLLCLFTQRALPLDSSHSALNVHNALGNCCFPLPLKSHRFTWLSSSVPLFIFKGLHQDKYPQVNFSGASGPPKSAPKNLLSRHKFVPVGWRNRKNVDGVEGEGRVPVAGLTQVLRRLGAYSRDHSALVRSSPLQRLGGEVLWNHTITGEYNHPFKTQVD